MYVECVMLQTITLALQLLPQLSDSGCVSRTHTAPLSRAFHTPDRNYSVLLDEETEVTEVR